MQITQNHGVLPTTASRTAHPGRVVKVNADGTVDVQWRTSKASTQRGVDPATLRAVGIFR